MKSTKSKALINGLQVTELKVTNLPNATGVHIEVVYALLEVDEKLNIVRNAHGRCTASPPGWGDTTNRLLKELFESMEETLLQKHFQIDKPLDGDDGNAPGIESKRYTEPEEVGQL